MACPRDSLGNLLTLAVGAHPGPRMHLGPCFSSTPWVRQRRHRTGVNSPGSDWGAGAGAITTRGTVTYPRPQPRLPVSRLPSWMSSSKPWCPQSSGSSGGHHTAVPSRAPAGGPKPSREALTTTICTPYGRRSPIACPHGPSRGSAFSVPSHREPPDPPSPLPVQNSSQRPPLRCLFQRSRGTSPLGGAVSPPDEGPQRPHATTAPPPCREATSEATAFG